MIVKTFISHKNERWGFVYQRNNKLKWVLYHKDDIIRRTKRVYYDDKLISEEIICETKEVHNPTFHKEFRTINEMKVYVDKNF